MMGRATVERLLVLRCWDEVLLEAVQQSGVLRVLCRMHLQQQVGPLAAAAAAAAVVLYQAVLMLRVPLAAAAAQPASVCCCLN
jgi:hypothetical protein